MHHDFHFSRFRRETFLFPIADGGTVLEFVSVLQKFSPFVWKFQGHVVVMVMILLRHVQNLKGQTAGNGVSFIGIGPLSITMSIRLKEKLGIVFTSIGRENGQLRGIFISLGVAVALGNPFTQFFIERSNQILRKLPFVFSG